METIKNIKNMERETMDAYKVGKITRSEWMDAFEALYETLYNAGITDYIFDWPNPL